MVHIHKGNLSIYYIYSWFHYDHCLSGITDSSGRYCSRPQDTRSQPLTMQNQSEGTVPQLKFPIKNASLMVITFCYMIIRVFWQSSCNLWKNLIHNLWAYVSDKFTLLTFSVLYLPHDIFSFCLFSCCSNPEWPLSCERGSAGIKSGSHSTLLLSLLLSL